MEKPYPPVNYADYLQVSGILKLQNPKSIEYGKPAHDEMLFIIIHQSYELWFKQILWEIDSVLELFNKPTVADRDTLKIVSRLNRVIEIQKLLIQQVDVLETMTPMDFLEFREFLYPASGFQSHQFRLIENKLGLKQRLKLNNQDYKELLCPMNQKAVEVAEEAPSLFSSLENWLERTPFIFSNAFPFWSAYKTAVDKMFAENETAILGSAMDADSKKTHLAGVQSSRESFNSIFDEANYAKLQEQNMWRLSFKALQASLFILLYRDEPLLQLPYNLMACLQNIDENFTQWRQRHALMAHRMLGAKMGTGGSAGHKYL
ncbi:MAG: tryptophan 2,3-dioxygenase, partial [Bdellovibrionaceae bacterium]|nr:tryptophan 2,3-dioxygenase [Pseudobdellovibrionaceae bacterium]